MIRPFRAACAAVAARVAMTLALLLPPPIGAPKADAATRIFSTNHVNSNDVRGLAAWDGRLAAASTGGVVLAGMPAGPFAKVLRTAGGLPSNQTLCAVASPAGLLWIGTVDAGIARLRPNGTFPRALTTFDGLPGSQVRALYRTGDSVWVGTNGGVALFTENAANGQIALRRSDSNASTAGGLISDDIRSIASLRDTVWVATGSGPRAYAAGTLAPVDAGHFGQCLALGELGGTVFSATSSSGVVYRRVAGAWTATGAGAPAGKGQALIVAPDGTLWVGTESGLARYDAGSDSWTAYRTEGPLIDGPGPDPARIERATADARGAWFVMGNTSSPGSGGGVVVHFDGTTWSALTTIGTGGELQAASTFGLLSDRNGRLWLGHCCADGATLPRTDRWDPATDTWDRPAVTNLFTFGLGPPGRVYGGGVEFGNGVYEFDETSGALLDSLTPANTAGGLGENELRGIAFDPSGRGWFALKSTGVDRWDGKGTAARADDDWDHFATGFPSPQTTSLAVLSDSVAYVGTASGVAPIRNDLIDLPRKSAINALLGGGAVTSLAHDPRGIVWIGSPTGLIRLDHATGALERFTVADGLVSDDIRALAWDDARHVLWVGTAQGISQVRPSEEGAPAFDDRVFVYPNPLGPSSGSLRIGGLTGEAEGEVRDATGAIVRRFRVNPASDAAWDGRAADGSPARSGIYLIVLRDGARTRILRAAVAR